MNHDELRLLTLHGLRLAGLATPRDIAEIHSLEPESVAEELVRLQADGLVATAGGTAAGSACGTPDRWRLTDRGRHHGEALLARQLDESAGCSVGGPRSVVRTAYDRFVALNPRLLDVCTRWQIVSRDPVVLNDHSDSEYDAEVIASMAEVDGLIQPICAELEAVLGRFGRYGPGFTEALEHLRRGETDWLTKPTILSYHTLWFQLHEDLLATLGLERAAETARLNSDPAVERPDAKTHAKTHAKTRKDSP